LGQRLQQADRDPTSSATISAARTVAASARCVAADVENLGPFMPVLPWVGILARQDRPIVVNEGFPGRGPTSVDA